MEKHISNLLLLVLVWTTVVHARRAIDLPGIQAGTIVLAGQEISRAPSRTYTLALANNIGSSPLGCALALAGYQALHHTNSQTYSALVSQVAFNNNNTIMSLNISFQDIQHGIRDNTVWLKLKWTYLLISSTFDGTYTNIWTTFAEFDPTNVTDAPVHSQGIAFQAMGGLAGDCDIYMEPLMQFDIQNCEAVPVKDQYKGGKIVIHAYIAGFSLAYKDDSSHYISVSKGNSLHPESDSLGWQIAYSPSYPNGPKISVPKSGVTWLQVSFVYVRTDFYSKDYPLNSQLKYSSSHVFIPVSSYNSREALVKGGHSRYNENYFSLPDAGYSIYGFSSLKFSKGSGGMFELELNLDPFLEEYQVQSPLGTSQQATISADVFISNIKDLCDWRRNANQLNGHSQQIRISPQLDIVSAVDVTRSIPLGHVTSGASPMVIKYGAVSSTQQVEITFVSTLIFRGSSPEDSLKLEVRFFENLYSESLVKDEVYSVRVKVNGELVFEEDYRHGSQLKPYISPTYYRALPSHSNSAVVESTLTFKSRQVSQELYLLVAVHSHKTVYNPYTKQCSQQCPPNLSLKATPSTLTCIQCDSRPGQVFSIKENACRCPEGTRLSNSRCQPCGSKCATCHPLNPSICLSCIGTGKLREGVCDDSDCPPGTFAALNSSITHCHTCEYPCLTCIKTPSFCLACPQKFYLYRTSPEIQTCVSVCPIGTLQQGSFCRECSSHCKLCVSSPDNCNQCEQPYILLEGACSQKCTGIIWATSSGKVCLKRCPDGLYDNGNSSCLPCASNCLTCDRLASNCTSCRTGVLVDFGVCINQCEPNQFILGGVCYNCSYPCSKCFRQKDRCIGCVEGMVVKEGQCVKQCEIGFFYQTSAMKCSQCSSGCAICIDRQQCLTCLNSSYTPHEGLCPFCGDSCLLCGLDNRCLACQAGRNLFNGACLQICPSSTVPSEGACVCSRGVLQDDRCIESCSSGYYAHNSLCLPCSSNCLECSAESTCTACFSGFMLKQSKCIQTNICHYGQFFRGGKCVKFCDEGWFFFEGNCFFGQCPDGYQSNFARGCIRQKLYRCPQNMYYREGSCVSNCGKGYWAAGLNKCEACGANCDSCVSRQECVSCKNGFANIGRECFYSGCVAGTVGVGKTCRRSCPSGTVEKNRICVERCPVKSYYFDNFCYFSCPSGKHDDYTCVL